MKSRIFLCQPSQLILEITCLGGRFWKFPKCNCSNQTCDYWLITPNQHFVLKVISFNGRQLQINKCTITVNGAMSITTCVINQVIYFLTNCFKNLNAPHDQIRFLWNFCHLFSVLFHDWNISINDSFWFFRVFFLGIISWNGASLFKGMEGGGFSDGGLHF